MFHERKTMTEETNETPSNEPSQSEVSQGGNDGGIQPKQNDDAYRAFQSKYDTTVAENEKLKQQLQLRMTEDEQEKYRMQEELAAARRREEEAQVRLEQERRKALDASMQETKNRLIKNDFPELEPWKERFTGENEEQIRQGMEAAQKELREWAGKYGKDFIAKEGSAESQQSPMTDSGPMSVDDFKKLSLKEKKRIVKDIKF